MSRTVYVNGTFVPEEEAKVSVFDRGFLFADAVYEVTAVLDGKLLEFNGHMARLERSLGELGMRMPMTRDEFLELHREMIRRNGVDQGGVYMQVTRGAADRNFVFPPKDTPETLVMFTQSKSVLGEKKGLKVVSVPDIRWGRRDIKTVQLLGASLAKMTAKNQGKDDAWFVEDGYVTEGSSNNAYIVQGDTIVTRNLSRSILPGITRAAVLKLIGELDLKLEERPFTIAEAQQASEAFITAATHFVYPVIEIDGAPISGGKPGPISKRLDQIYIEEARKNAI